LFVAAAYLIFPFAQYVNMTWGCLLGSAAGVILGRREVQFYRAKGGAFYPAPQGKHTFLWEMVLCFVGFGLLAVFFVNFPLVAEAAFQFAPVVWTTLFSLQ